MSGEDNSGSSYGGRGGSSGIGRGLGRGAIIQHLLKLAATSSSSDEMSKGPGSAGKSDEPPKDSGLETSPLFSTDSSSTRGFSRPHHSFQPISSSSSDNTVPSHRVPASSLGRGARIASLIESDLFSDSKTEVSESSTIGRGRGQLFSSLEGVVRENRDKRAAVPVSVQGPSTISQSSSVKQATNVQPEKIDKKPQTSLTDQMKQLTVKSETELVPVIKKGKAGVTVKCITNYITLNTDPNKGVFEYEVKFEPAIHSMNLRHTLLNTMRDKIGNTKTFDGTILYLPTLLPQTVTTLTTQNENDKSSVTLTIIFKRKKLFSECVALYNILFTRIMKQLNYVKFGRKQFDPSAPKIIPQHKLEVWPGYVTAVDEYEGGVMLCLDVSHRLLCQTTVLDYLRKIYQSAREDFQRKAYESLLGNVVLTRYNNRTYRIDDIKFDSNPMDTFQLNDKTITYVDYYKMQYNIQIRDLNQPLLIHSEERRVVGKEEKELFTFALIPEISYLTGLTNDQRSDNRLMRDISSTTRVSPNQRLHSFRQFCSNVNNVPKAKEILSNWGLTLNMEPNMVEARQLGTETIKFGNRTVDLQIDGDFNKSVTTSEAIDVINITNWLLIHTTQDTSYAKKFVEYLEMNSRPMGITVMRPQIEVLRDDKTETYVHKLRQLINPKLQIIVFICPTSRDDRYAAIKKICCSELPIPSQVINSRTLSNDQKNRAIVQKIALQMNCKLGGSLWSINIPFRNVMICGIDTFHDSLKKQNSVSSFVASLNGTYTRWYSKACIQSEKEEFIHGLCQSVVAALKAYQRLNNELPKRIIIYRDGVSDSQLRICQQFEIPQLINACSIENENYKPEVTFIVVQKRINTRIFGLAGRDLVNPPPGLVLDHTITRRFLYDFFLIPQSVRQGTVSPTHYIVVYDSANFEPDILQRLSYKLCFLYYNWPGSVRVPASCQYAHKMAYLVGQSIKRLPAEKLCDKLFYL